MPKRKSRNYSGMGRTIDGDYYRAMGSHSTKKRANESAHYYRRTGKKVRIIRRDNGYSVFVSADDRKTRVHKK